MPGQPDGPAEQRATEQTPTEQQTPAEQTPIAHPGSRVDEDLSEADQLDVAHQLGRPLRGATRAAHRCPCGTVDVVATAPRLDDGTPFPTLFYLTCPRATGAVSTLESEGLMRELAEQLATDDELAEAYLQAHQAYLARRDELAQTWQQSVPEIDGVSAGGMPDRVKCLHVLVGHALAAGPGVNPLGDEALRRLPAWWARGRCV